MLKEEIPKLIKSLFSRLETKLDQSDADVNSVANKLVKRNKNGDIFVNRVILPNYSSLVALSADGTSEKVLAFVGADNRPNIGNTTDQLLLRSLNQPSVRVGGVEGLLHTQHNLPIETGSWTPILSNETVRFQMNTASTSGRYHRVGDLVYIQGRARGAGKTGVSGGKLTIEGLPFASQYSGQHVNLSIYSGLVFTSDVKEVSTYMQAGTNKFSFYYSRSGASYQAWNCDNVSGECDIYFSGIYKIN